MRNLRLALRTLFKTPFVTIVAILSLALGIGANAAIYSLFNELLSSSLPVDHPERLVNFGGNLVSPGSHQCGQAGDCDVVFSYRMFRDLEAQPGPFAGVAGHVIVSMNIALRGETISGNGEMVSGSYFPVLGLRPAAGRLFGAEDDKVIGGHPIAVLSHAFWQARGADPSLIGQTIVVNGQSLTIVGVAPAGFEGTTVGNRPDVFVPLTMHGQLAGLTQWDDRRRYWVYVIARLTPGVTLAQAEARENVLYHRIINTVEVPLQTDVSAATLERFKAKRLALEDGRRGQSRLQGQTRMPVTLLFGITMIVLAIACANIANLLLARAANRSLEMAVRLSLGATRSQLLAQLLTESVLLAVLGGMAGLAVAYATLRGIASLLPSTILTTISMSLSGTAVAFAGLLSMATGLLFGLFPALHSTRPDLVTTLRDNSGKTSSTRAAARFRTSLVTAQIALSMSLLVSAGLFIKSLARVSRVDLGINAEQVLTFHLSPELNGYTKPRSAQFFAQVEERLGALPGVRGVVAARVPLIADNNWDNPLNVQGFTKTPDTDDSGNYNAVGPDFFKILGIPLRSGREFTPADVSGAPKVAIVNEAFTKKFGLGNNAVGKMMGIGHTFNDHDLDIQIVGVARDAKYSEVKETVKAEYFVPYKQDTTVGDLHFYVRTALPTQIVITQVRGIIAALDPNLPLEHFQPLPAQIRDNVYLDRMITMLSAAFAALATLLAAIGLYGVLTYSVVQRTREIGVRMALGAGSSRIVGMVLRQVALMTVVGATIGAAAAYAIGRGVSSLLYDMPGHDGLVMAGSVALLASVALVAGYLPAIRASRVDPMNALRYE